MNKIKVAVVGCGNISPKYFGQMKQYPVLEVKALSDLSPEKAETRSKEFEIPAKTTEEILSDPEIKIIVNLSTPPGHAPIAMKALEAGKSVYNEKPLAVTRQDGQKIIDLAKKKKLLAGGAPDTFLGTGQQTARMAIDKGLIGRPVAATAFMLCHGHESWHPDPEFYYKTGGGPMFDMGPYYLTALVNLLGPVKRVTGSAGISFPERTITSKLKFGTKIKVETPTHIAGIMDFANNAIGTIITSFDVWHGGLPHITIYGSEGTLQVPDPNCFEGEVKYKRSDSKEWITVEPQAGFFGKERGAGVADMAYALISGRKHRASGELAFHVLDTMQSFLEASNQNKHITLSSSCSRPDALPAGLPDYTLD